MQERLNAAGADPPLAEDSAFGPLTRAAVERFQRDQGLEVDGRVGPQTLAALEGTRAARPVDGVDGPGAPRRQGAAPATTQPGASPTPTTVRPRRGLSGSGEPVRTASPSSSSPLPGALTGAARTRAAAALDGANGPEARQVLRGLMASERYRALPEASQARLLTTVTQPASGILMAASGPGAARGALANGRTISARVLQATQLLSSPAMSRASAADRARIVDVYAAAPGSQTLRLAGVGAPDRLSGRDLRGGTMLESLHQMATGPLAPGLNRTSLLQSTIAEVENPANIEQWQQGTCAATSTTMRLAARSPAEYTRLVAGLATPGGRVTLADGAELARNRGSIADTRTGRTQSERLLQDSFMGFANGDLDYDVGADTNRGAGGGGGLNSAEVTRLQTSVFNEPYRTVTTAGRQVTRDAGFLEQRWRNLRNNIDRLTFGINPNAPMQVLRQELNAGRTAQIGMTWGEGRHAGHAVVVERIENGRVFFRNPHGNAYHGQPVGSSLDPPPRRVEAENFQSMDLREFQRRLTSVSARI